MKTYYLRELRNPGFIVTSIDEDHTRLWADPITGSEHAIIRKREKTQEISVDEKRTSYTSIIPEILETRSDESEYILTQEYYVEKETQFHLLWGQRFFSLAKRLAHKRNISDTFLLALLESALEESWTKEEILEEIGH